MPLFGVFVSFCYQTYREGNNLGLTLLRSKTKRRRTVGLLKYQWKTNLGLVKQFNLDEKHWQCWRALSYERYPLYVFISYVLFITNMLSALLHHRYKHEHSTYHQNTHHHSPMVHAHFTRSYVSSRCATWYNNVSAEFPEFSARTMVCQVNLWMEEKHEEHSWEKTMWCRDGWILVNLLKELPMHEIYI